MDIWQVVISSGKAGLVAGLIAGIIAGIGGGLARKARRHRENQDKPPEKLS